MSRQMMRTSSFLSILSFSAPTSRRNSAKSSPVPRKLMYWFWNQTLFFADLISFSAFSA